MAFMFEPRFPQQVTGYAAGIAQRRLGYDGYGSALSKRFDASRP
jgi:homogentisate 1,2-dioxygenase